MQHALGQYQIGVVDRRGSVIAILSAGHSLDDAKRVLDRYELSILAPETILSHGLPAAPSADRLRRKSRL